MNEQVENADPVAHDSYDDETESTCSDFKLYVDEQNEENGCEDAAVNEEEAVQPTGEEVGGEEEMKAKQSATAKEEVSNNAATAAPAETHRPSRRQLQCRLNGMMIFLMV